MEKGLHWSVSLLAFTLISVALQVPAQAARKAPANALPSRSMGGVRCRKGGPGQVSEGRNANSGIYYEKAMRWFTAARGAERAPA
jgi:hypothetical protein